MIYIGTKFYRYEQEKEDATIYRVVDYQNSETVVLRNEETKEKDKIKLETLKEKYVMITISGLVTFSKVEIGKGNDDVIVSLYRDVELKKKSMLPYCVCRQGITDIFYKMAGGDKEYYGASVSIDTIPSGISFDIMVACESVYEKCNQFIAIYKDDTLDSILELVKSKEYDKTLNLAFLDHLQFVSKDYGSMYYSTMLGKDNFQGYVKTLKNLLVSTNFMFDFYKGFDIYPMDFDLTDFDQQALPDDYRIILSKLLCKNIDKALVVKFGYDIQLSLIKKDYILISDKNGNLYIIIFTTSGQYHIPVEDIVSDDAIKVMHQRMNTLSVQTAYDHIRIDKNKYV